MISQHWFCGVRQQAITWANVDPDLLLPYGITRPEWVKYISWSIFFFSLNDLFMVLYAFSCGESEFYIEISLFVYAKKFIAPQKF